MKKYLRIKITGHEFIAAFENDSKIGNQPDFKSDGVAVWVSEYDETKVKEPKKAL